MSSLGVLLGAICAGLLLYCTCSYSGLSSRSSTTLENYNFELYDGIKHKVKINQQRCCSEAWGEEGKLWGKMHPMIPSKSDFVLVWTKKTKHYYFNPKCPLPNIMLWCLKGECSTKNLYPWSPLYATRPKLGNTLPQSPLPTVPYLLRLQERACLRMNEEMNMNDRSTIEYNPPATGMKLERLETDYHTRDITQMMAKCLVKTLEMGFLMKMRISLTCAHHRCSAGHLSSSAWLWLWPRETACRNQKVAASDCSLQHQWTV